MDGLVLELDGTGTNEWALLVDMGCWVSVEVCM